MRRVWIVLGCAVGMLVGFSASYFSTLSIFLKPLAASFGWGRGQTSTIASLAQLGICIGAPITGRVIARLGVLRVVLGSTILYAVGVFALSMSAGNVFLFAGLSLVLGMVAVGTTPPGYLSVMPSQFDKRLGLAMGLAQIGLGVGNAMMPMLTQRWISAGSWQSAYRHIAGAILIGGIVACLLLWCAGGLTFQRRVPVVRASDVATAQQRAWSMIFSKRFMVLVVALFIVSCAGLGAMVHLVSLLTDRGLAFVQASKISAPLGIGVLIGRSVTGALLDIVDARFVAAAEFAIGGAGLVLIALASGADLTLISVGAFLFAFVMGAEGDMVPFFIRRYFGIESFSFLYGVLFMFFALGGVVGPAIFGSVFDHLHSYTAAYTGAGIACVVCALLMLTLGKYVYPVEKHA